MCKLLDSELLNIEGLSIVEMYIYMTFCRISHAQFRKLHQTRLLRLVFSRELFL